MSKYRVIGKPGVAAQATLLGDREIGTVFSNSRFTDEEEQSLIGAGVIVLEGGASESDKPKAAGKESGASKAKH